MSADPQAAVERRIAARHLLQRPLTCQEHDPEVFRLIRRHAPELDRWFTQRLGYRLDLTGDSARLFKTGTVADHRPLRTRSGRPLHQLEHVLMALVLASTVAGPAVTSLRDLVDTVRSAAAEAEIPLAGDATERRALVTVLRWMIDHGLATEMHAQVDDYATDETADAVLRLRPDRIVSMPLPPVIDAPDADTLLTRAEHRGHTRRWLRARLVEEPVLYRHELADDEWSELRRRLGEEARILDEMFGLVIEARAEGVATIDPAGSLSGRRFPVGGTLGHAAVLVIDALVRRAGDAGLDHFPPTAAGEIMDVVVGVVDRHRRAWAKDMVAAPERLAREVIDLLVELRLAERLTPGAGPGRRDQDAAPPAPGLHPANGTGPPASGRHADHDAADEPRVRLLPAAARFRPHTPTPETPGPQETLW